jgi:amidophosphoribosyltransferase
MEIIRLLDRKLNEECGIVGVLGDKSASNWVYLGLFALQHRGQEGCGIISHNPDMGEDDQDVSGNFHVHKAFGLVSDSVTSQVLDKLVGETAIGHVRYSTNGGKLIQNVQPFTFKTALGPLAIAHNGNLTNANKIKNELISQGAIFQSTSDSEVFVHLIARDSQKTIRERIFSVMEQVSGAYSLLLLAEDRMFAVRDPNGFRPLVIGKRNDSYIVASETCALDLIDAEYIREVEPGEVVEITKSGLESFFPLEKRKTSFCSFEPIYFARPDSIVFGDVVYGLRKNMGSILAKEAPVEGADVVIAVPDSGVPMAMGFANAAGLPLELGLVRNHYVGRTFIQPAQDIRDFGVKLKLNPVASALKGKSVVVVDDSIVRGTTSVKIIRMLKDAGAKEIHMRVGSPPITHSCYFGVDTPTRDRLLAAQKNINEIKDYIGCDSVGYLSVDGLKEAINTTGGDAYCTACFHGKYPEKTWEDISPAPTDASGGPGFISS